MTAPRSRAAADRRAEPNDRGEVGCPVSELFAMLGQPHMLRILHAFQEGRGGPIRFTDLERRLALSPKTLSVRLRTLVEAGFVSRRAFNEIPPRVEYAPTPKTAELKELFGALDRWAGRNTLTAVPQITTLGKLPA